MSYHQYGEYYELTALYAKSEYQRKGVGQKLLHFFEQQIENDGVVFVKVLKNAPWSMNFYLKNGYVPIDPKMREAAESINIRERPWSVVLYKRIPNHTVLN